MYIIEQLNEQQKKAVNHLYGPALVVASAGAGKTRVLTCRIAHLLQQGISSHAILALTFTNKAAQNMKNQILQIMPNQESDLTYLWMGTFHSIFAKILRYDHHHTDFTSNFTIYDRQDSLNLIKFIIKNMQLDDKEEYKPSVVLRLIARAKNRLEKDLQSKKHPRINDIYTQYVNRCKQANVMDFDDILFTFSSLLKNKPTVLQKYQQKFQFILVDEFQDTNYAQNNILKLLADAHQNIFVVGDDAQSIYSFRGAEIENILHFKNDYPKYKEYKLERNYRSVQNIVNASNCIIKNNHRKIDKTVYSNKELGEKIKLLPATTDFEEGFLVANAIHEDNFYNNIALNDIAILYRTNNQSRIFEETFRRKNIPYRIFGGLSFYQRKEIKDILAYFRFVINPNDEEAFCRIVNFPRRGIGTTTVTKILTKVQNTKFSLSNVLKNIDKFTLVNKGLSNKIASFYSQIENSHALLKEFSAVDLARYICNESRFIETLKSDTSPEGISRYENVLELLNDIHSFSETEKSVENPYNLSAYLEKISLLTNLDEEDKNTTQRVSLMTIHSAKGLEFKNVYIVGVEERLLPSYGMKDYINSEELEEERRLFYVATTRAMKKVTISYAKMRNKWGNVQLSTPSRFIREIDSKYIEKQDEGKFGDKYPSINRITFSDNVNLGKSSSKTANYDNFSANSDSKIVVGMNVIHARFGKGKVISLEGVTRNEKKAIIFFQNIGQKKLLLKYAKLKITT